MKSTINPETPVREIPHFDTGGWSVCTRHGMVWRLFEDDEKQMNPTLVDQAVAATKSIIGTGLPPFGGWR